MNFKFGLVVLAAIPGNVWVSPTFAEPATGWVVTNWAAGDAASLTVFDADTDSPSVVPATGVSLMAGYPSVSLNDGDLIQGSASMTITGATNPFLQFRIGLFRETGSGPSTGDGTGYTGFTIETEGNLKENNGATNPFSTPGSVTISLGTPFSESLSTPPEFT